MNYMQQFYIFFGFSISVKGSLMCIIVYKSFHVVGQSQKPLQDFFSGAGVSLISFIFSGSGSISFSLNLKPQYFKLFLQNTLFSKLRVVFLESRRSNTRFKVSSYCLVFSENMKNSSAILVVQRRLRRSSKDNVPGQILSLAHAFAVWWAQACEDVVDFRPSQKQMS